MIIFENDYAAGCAPEIMERLAASNLEQTTTYGKDDYCKRASQMILEQAQLPEGEVFYFVGGTIANATAASYLLRPYQGVLCAASAHITAHEAGAIEAGGNKVLTIPSEDGKLTPDQIEQAVMAYRNDHAWQQLVEPGMVYISQSTENGTVYNKAELEGLHEVCQKYGMPLYVDGARLGYGLAAPGNDVTLADLGRLCDMFYIGGTKQGALFGEAMVICNPAYRQGFSNMMRHKGAVLAKGRLMGIQFETLFEDGLYFRLAAYANKLAMKIRGVLEEKGCVLPYDNRTNQQFVLWPVETIRQVEQQYQLYDFGPQAPSGLHLARFTTSWYTKEEDVDALVADLRRWL